MALSETIPRVDGLPAPETPSAPAQLLTMDPDVLAGLDPRLLEAVMHADEQVAAAAAQEAAARAQLTSAEADLLQNESNLDSWARKQPPLLFKVEGSAVRRRHAEQARSSAQAALETAYAAAWRVRYVAATEAVSAAAAAAEAALEAWRSEGLQLRHFHALLVTAAADARLALLGYQPRDGTIEDLQNDNLDVRGHVLSLQPPRGTAHTPEADAARAAFAAMQAPSNG